MRLTSTVERDEFLALLGVSPASRVLEAEDAAVNERDDSYDAILCVDTIAELEDRGAALDSWARVVKPGGRILYTDPAIVAGLITSEELADRSATGPSVFSPQGENESLIEAAGLRLLRADDATDAMAEAAAARRAERARRETELVADEGRARFDLVQRYLAIDAPARRRAPARADRVPAGDMRVSDEPDKPNVVIFPPLLFVIAFVIGVVARISSGMTTGLSRGRFASAVPRSSSAASRSRIGPKTS